MIIDINEIAIYFWTQCSEIMHSIKEVDEVVYYNNIISNTCLGSKYGTFCDISYKRD